MTAEDQRQIVQDYIRIISTHDLDEVQALYAENATVEDPVGSDPLQGLEAIREFYAKAFSMGIRAESTGEIRCAENAVAFPFRISLQLGDNQMTIDVIDVFELNESGKIQSMKAYWGPANSKMEPAA
jgi:steroid delta-isomerase